MPRLAGFRERFECDVAWQGVVDGPVYPFEWNSGINMPPNALRTTWYGSSPHPGVAPVVSAPGIMFDDRTSAHIFDVALDRQDVMLTMLVGNKTPFISTGPWLRGTLYETLRVAVDALSEGRILGKQILEEARALDRGLLRMLHIPTRMPFACELRRLSEHTPVAVATMHLRMLVTREVS